MNDPSCEDIMGNMEDYICRLTKLVLILNKVGINT